MSSIIYCEKCHKKKRFGSYKESVKKINEVSKKEVNNLCTSSCGLGKKNFFVQINEDLIIEKDFDQMLKKIKEYDED